MKETWKAVVGYEGIYEASNIGRIKSLAHFIDMGVQVFLEVIRY